MKLNSHIDIEFEGEAKEIRMGRFSGVLEIGENTENPNFDYINIPNRYVRQLIRELVKLYPEWDKE
ncbi:hypothetical protein [Providencia stuartii]|uniref:hypothetical protein n=1 Tax=Providencia stuartii TaxID=588 RepID=UPI00073B1757|nr:MULTISPECIES: hypothetical protein [Providencia]KSX93960.1 hypothetical protein APT95_15380 [Providencia stuartii]MCL8323666.1 hypothetical protein [Providencia thailandensis]MDT2015819.1 hypothetical protein [Providencia stuartii]MDT2083042.1 hypothetical protein [Providencia stuartii]MDX7495509.1 hypothetical protein [Providencia stuartii]